MNSEQLKALAQRAVESKGWRWMPGMRDLRTVLDSSRVRYIGPKNGLRLWAIPSTDIETGEFDASIGWVDTYQSNDHELLPDLSDPATLGCLLALVREVWGEDARPLKTDYFAKWVVVHGNRADDCSYPQPTEAEALVAALEAAP